jgi:hypothetical protein
LQIGRVKAEAEGWAFTGVLPLVDGAYPVVSRLKEGGEGGGGDCGVGQRDGGGGQGRHPLVFRYMGRSTEEADTL